MVLKACIILVTIYCLFDAKENPNALGNLSTSGATDRYKIAW